ncbi:GDYXXLXY domain-containing protein [Halosquirtibacter xylanolyticus]|uniref:GDYXXLXY domain-containing protein n=1 Tax=Halosquirtibacter xylanolyticus TaxID=3374599 RepID=UPI003749D611|nr:GDYXXLXY domain-containing protein [Prolixibacteraceae bacterium]
MKNIKYIFPLFIVMVLIQWFIPMKMVWDNEAILRNGNVYKFKTAPVDPTDIFRGKYVHLSFDVETLKVQNAKAFRYGDKVFLTIVKNQNGYASIKRVSTDVPNDDYDYIKAEINYVKAEKQQIVVRFPFERFYMEESLALPAEKAHRKSMKRSNSKTYAIVKVLDGNSLVEEVMIDDKPIRDVALESVEK